MFYHTRRISLTSYSSASLTPSAPLLTFRPFLTPLPSAPLLTFFSSNCLMRKASFSSMALLSSSALVPAPRVRAAIMAWKASCSASRSAACLSSSLSEEGVTQED